MNLAILIGVSDYVAAKLLPGCKNDVNIIHNLVQSTNKYQDILFLSEKTNSQDVKEKVSDFILKHQNTEEIDEIFFYYTGHGLFHEGEFHFVLSDFDRTWLNRTTYKNNELDELLKSLNPKLTVKVIDACHSGVKYVKDVNDLELKKVLNESKEKFNNCYFMFSSQADEVSWATQLISYFTLSFVNSIINHGTNGIRYRDIMDYVSDDFLRSDIGQTPYYVTQSKNTEIFCKIDDPLKEKLKQLIDNINGTSQRQENKNKNQLSLVEIVKKDAEKYCKDIKEVHSLLESIKNKVNDFKVNDKLNGLFRTQVDFNQETYDYISNIDIVAKSLERKFEDYFIILKYINKTVKVPQKNTLGAQLFKLPSFFENEKNVEIKYVEENRDVINSFNISEENLPFTSINIDLYPEYPNISMFNCSIIFAFSKVNIVFFYSFNTFKEVSWDSYELEDIDWRQTRQFVMKEQDSVINSIGQICAGFLSYVEKNLEKKFGKELEKVSDGEDNDKQPKPKPPIAKPQLPVSVQ